MHRGVAAMVAARLGRQDGITLHERVRAYVQVA